MKNKFYKIPKRIFEEEKYEKLTANSVLIYGYLSSMAGLSKKNKWIDKDGNVYVKASKKTIGEDLNIKSEKTVVTAFKQLKEVGLIKEKRQGLGKANIIFVNEITTTEKDDEANEPGKEFDNDSSNNDSNDLPNGVEQEAKEEDLDSPRVEKKSEEKPLISENVEADAEILCNELGVSWVVGMSLMQVIAERKLDLKPKDIIELTKQKEKEGTQKPFNAVWDAIMRNEIK